MLILLYGKVWGKLTRISVCCCVKLPLSFSLSLSHTHTDTHTHKHTHTHTLIKTNTQTQTHKHTLSHTHIHTLSHALGISLFWNIWNELTNTCTDARLEHNFIREIKMIKKDWEFFFKFGLYILIHKDFLSFALLPKFSLPALMLPYMFKKHNFV